MIKIIGGLVYDNRKDEFLASVDGTDGRVVRSRGGLVERKALISESVHLHGASGTAYVFRSEPGTFLDSDRKETVRKLSKKSLVKWFNDYSDKISSYEAEKLVALIGKMPG